MTREQFITQVEATQKAFRCFLVALCCGDKVLADDIAQESYIKAYLSCENLTNAERFKTWLHTIGYNTFLNHKRAERFTVDYEAARDIRSHDDADASFAYQGLYSALQQLPPRERNSVLLFYMEGYSVKEIALIEDTTQDAVKQHLSRGRKHLRSLLDTYM